MKPTSQVGRDARNVMEDSLTSSFVGIDVGVSQKRAQSRYHESFIYGTNDEIDSMSPRYVKAYAKRCRDGWFDLLCHG